MTIANDLHAARDTLLRLRLEPFLAGLGNAQADGHRPAAAGFGSGGTGGDPCTQPERGALNLDPDERRPDPVARDLNDIRRLAATLRAATTEIERLAAIYSPHRPSAHIAATVPDREMIGADGHAMWCTHCLRHGGKSSTDPKRPNMGLCAWCANWQATEGDLPAPLLVNTHLAGGRITVALVARAKRTLLNQPPSGRRQRRAT